MTEANELEEGLKDLHRSWSRIPTLMGRTLYSVIIQQHDDVISYVIEEFSERIGIRTMDSRIIPATTGGVSKEFYEKVSRIRDSEKDRAYPAILHQILEETAQPRQLMFLGMKETFLEDYDNGKVKARDEYVRDEIEYEMKNGDGLYGRHKDLLTPEEKEKQTKEDAEPQSQLILPGQMQQRPRQQHGQREQPQKPKREESPSGIITGISIDDIKKFGK